MSMMPQTLQMHIGAYLTRASVLPVMSRSQRLLWCLICTLALETISHRNRY